MKQKFDKKSVQKIDELDARIAEIEQDDEMKDDTNEVNNKEYRIPDKQQLKDIAKKNEEHKLEILVYQNLSHITIDVIEKIRGKIKECEFNSEKTGGECKAGTITLRIMKSGSVPKGSVEEVRRLLNCNFPQKQINLEVLWEGQ